MRRRTARRLRSLRPWLFAGVGALLFAGFLYFVVSHAPSNPLSPSQVAELNQENDAKLAAQAAEDEAAAKRAVTLTVKRPENRPLRVLFAGDSLTAGYYATTESKSFTARVMRSIGGETSVFFGQQRANGAGKVADIERVESDVDLAVVELGTDDVVDQDLVSFERDYGALLDKIEAGSPEVPLLCLGVWHEFDEGYDDVIRNVCTDRGGVFQALTTLQRDDLNHGPPGREVYRGTSDVFHPNDEGHSKIADAVMYHVDVED